jgi:hypothetical protein
MRSKSWILFLLGALLALTIAPAAFAQAGTAKVRVVHASPDAPAVDVIVNGNKALTNVPFFAASAYLDLPAGSYDIQVVPAGATSPVVIDAKGVRIEAGKAYTIAATGKLAEIKPTILIDDLSAPAAGKAHVRVIHFSPDAPAVDIKVAGGPTLISESGLSEGEQLPASRCWQLRSAGYPGWRYHSGARSEGCSSGSR